MITARKNKSIIPAVVITIAGFAALFLLLGALLGNAADTSSEEALKAVRDGIIRASVTCYAIEGTYPESLQYLIDNYNLAVDLDRYNVYYSRISDNLMPNIIVKPRGEQNE
jgi:uncharacterized membrane protein